MTQKINKDLTFDDFKKLASNEKLSEYEKIGFPDSYRKKYEKKIFQNIKKILLLDRADITFFDIGCGCSELPKMLIKNAQDYNQNLHVVDSSEMLNNLSSYNYAIKHCLKFPNDFISDKYENSADVVLIYSVLQHVFLETNPFYFIDNAVKLLKNGGRLLLGDIPNISKRNRFFSSDAGILFHQKFTKTKTFPELSTNNLNENTIDDSLIFAILNRYRLAGYESYLLEQPDDLPMHNRREDILIVKN